jgi:BirA family biotin operon repressor/biotin-[acetyl-CoA-carboxylase] ligase
MSSADFRAHGAAAVPREFLAAIDQVRSRLGRLDGDILYFPEVGSTNDVAAALASSGGAGRVVLADRQTAGRGRMGRRWFSPPGGGLYVSIVVPIHTARSSPQRVTALVTLAAGVALAEAIEATTGLEPQIKWPNDLLIEGRKVAGILAEGIAGGSSSPEESTVSLVVLGYGVNVGRVDYPPDLADRATSLELELGRTVGRAALFAESLAALDARHGDLLEGRFDVILDAWRQRAPMRSGARVSWETPAGPRAGVTEDVDEYGALLVRTAAGTERLIAGEVHWTPDAARD